LDKKKKSINRKDFLKKSSAGLLTLGFWGSALTGLFIESKIRAKVNPSYRTLGRTGIKVSTVGFGASRTMEPSLLKTALDAGVNFVDTGRSYFNGQNEEMVGKVIHENRKQVVVQSRVRLRLRENETSLNNPRVVKRIKAQLENGLDESLKALQTDYIDIYLLHRVNALELLSHEVVMDFFEKAKKEGKIRACGFSSHSNQIELLKFMNKTRFYDVAMIPFNHSGAYTHSKSGNYREWDQEAVIEQCREAEKNGLGIIAMKTCSGGPYAPSKSEKPSYVAGLRWILKHSFISTMAVAMGNVNEINEDIQAMSSI